MDTRVAVVGQLKTSGTTVLPPEALSVAPGTGPGAPDTRVTGPVPLVTVMESMETTCVL
jgi:hypothetical protein